MIDFGSLVPYVILGAAIAGPFVFVRFLSRGEPLDLFRMFVAPAELPWPRGVQEEEPRPWRWDAHSSWTAEAARSESASLDSVPEAA